MWRLCSGVASGAGPRPLISSSSSSFWSHAAPTRSRTVTVTLSVQQRGAAGGGFRAAALAADPFNVLSKGTNPFWPPGPQYMKYKSVRWLVDNIWVIATYQLVLEVGFSAAFGFLLWFKKVSPDGIVDWLRERHYPFCNWFAFDDCVYTDPVKVGPFSLNAAKLTAGHTGHAIANGLLPVQLLLLIVTFPLATRCQRLWHRYVLKTPMPSARVMGSSTAPSASGAPGGVQQATASTAASGATKRSAYGGKGGSSSGSGMASARSPPRSKPASTSAIPQRRPSYVSPKPQPGGPSRK